MSKFNPHHLIIADEHIYGQQCEKWLPETSNQHVLICLQASQSIDSDSLKALLEANAVLSHQEQKLVLVSPSPAIRTLLYFTQVADILPIFPRTQDALHFLNN